MSTVTLVKDIVVHYSVEAIFIPMSLTSESYCCACVPQWAFHNEPTPLKLFVQIC